MEVEVEEEVEVEVEVEVEMEVETSVQVREVTVQWSRHHQSLRLPARGCPGPLPLLPPRQEIKHFPQFCLYYGHGVCVAQAGEFQTSL